MGRRWFAVVGLMALVLALVAAPAQAMLVGYWTFDGDLTDSSSFGLNGTPNGSPTFGANVPPTIGTGQSLGLNGSSYVSVAPPTTFAVNSTYTVTAWAQVTATGGAQNFFDTRRPQDNGFDAKFLNGTQIHGDIGNGAAWVTTSADALIGYSANAWYHIAYVVSPTGYNIYVHDAAGSLAASASGIYGANTPVLIDANHGINMGRYSGGGEPLNGRIDNVAIWSQALNLAQVHSLALGSSPLAIPTAQPGTISYLPITNDADCGISSTKTYTHAIDCGLGNPAANINGVQFTRATIAAMPANFSFAANSGSRNDHAGNASHNVTGNVAQLLTDMIYNGGNTAGGVATYKLLNLIPGVDYDARVYTRRWSVGALPRTSIISFSTDGGSAPQYQVTIDEDDATKSPPGLDAPNRAYAISYKYKPLTSELAVRFQELNPNYSWHMYGVTNEFLLPTSKLNARITADDSYELYVSGIDSQLGALIGSGSGFGTPEDWSFDVPIGQPLYIHIVGHNAAGSPSSAGVIGQFTGGMETDKAMPVQFYTDALLWAGNATGFGDAMSPLNDLGAYGVAPWGTTPGVGAFGVGAHWVWLGEGIRPAGETVYLSYAFMVPPVPEPATLVLLAGGLLVLARRRRRE